MLQARALRLMVMAGTITALAGCVNPALTVVPGQGKSYSDLQRDDAACRATPVTTGQAATPTAGTSASVDRGDYYTCMAAHGQSVIEQRPAAYPIYAAYPVYPYAYAYPYPYPYGYPFYAGYPFASPYYGPYGALGIGFGVGSGFYGGGYFGRGYFGRAYYGRGYEGFHHERFHGGGFRDGGGFHGRGYHR
ncbi:MAG: hypothetical protein M3N26_10995 [Pseudomonadota bacterium]|nr:hypothetical protein [Pseudomonadota bacterium]